MLESGRQQISHINQQLFHLLQERKELVGKIQSLKKNSWAPERELEIFRLYKHEFPDANQYEDFIFSLIIESQSIAYGYPAWSQAEHLIHPANCISHQLNPILLMVKNKPEYEALNLKPLYKEKIESI